MYTQNNMISVRQCFRTGILENITLGMVVIPYVAVNLAGKWHFPAMLIGLLMGGVYMAVMYALSKSVTKDTLENLKNLKGVGGAIGILYSIRFLIRIGIVLYFFGKTMQEYLLQSYNLWVIIIAFVLVCGYGAARDIEKRGRMLELLFPWMVVPIILVAVFAISNINLDELLEGLRGVNYENIRGEAGFLDVLKAGYVCFLVMSTSELLLFTMPYQKENSWRNALKLGLWILISIFLAYIFIIGILGGHWVASDSQAALNVMEAAFIPGGFIERADYPVLIFWVIGVFAIVSGYIFYARKGWEICRACIKGSAVTKGKLSLWIVMILACLAAWLWSLPNISVYLAQYMLWADVAISLIIPVILLNRSGSITSLKAVKKQLGAVVIVVLITASLSGCVNKEFAPISKARESIEEREYVTNITFNGEEDITFTVADIKKYIKDATGTFETKEEKLKGESLAQVMDDYHRENGRQLDIGHLDGITFKDVADERVREYALEMSNMSHMGKSVVVTIKDSQGEKKIDLRQLIKCAYSGEEFP